MDQAMSTIEVARSTLYEEVWATPMSRLAERYGLSDVALKKVCRKMGIPTPPRGYWARRRHGHAVRRPALPAPLPGTPQKHTFYLRPKGLEEPDFKPEIPARLQTAADTLVVSATLRNPDLFVARTRDALKNRLATKRFALDQYGRVAPGGPGTFDVDLCPASIPRALRILDALVRGARRAGFEVADRGRAVHFVVEGEEVHFRLREPTRQERIELPKEKRHWGRYEFRHHPTGRLELEITQDRWWIPRHVWRDTERQRLEDLLGSFLVGVYRAACTYRDSRLEDERQREEERRREEEQRRLERLRAEEAERRRRLEEQAERWRRSRDVAAFVDEVARRAAAAPLEGEAKEALGAWLAWAREHAERLDPLSRGLPPFPEPTEGRRRIL